MKQCQLEKDWNTGTQTTQANISCNNSNVCRVNKICKDVSRIIYFNFDKRNHFANKCTKLF